MRPDAAPLPDDVALCHQIIRELQREVAELKARLNQNSSNSSKTPSSDPPSVKRAPPKRPTGKKRGGQPGHKPHRRDLVSPEKVAASFNIKPEVCRGCGAVLLGDDPEPLRHQVTELPPIEPVVTEYRLHRLTCEECGERTCGQLPTGVPRGAFGPRLQAVLSLLGGAYRLGKRPIQSLAADLFGLTISTGMVCKLERATSESLESAVEELREYVRKQDAGADETSWRENRSKAWLWVAVTQVATVFTIAGTRGAECSCKKTAGTCRKLLKQESFPWNFVWIEGIEPTNNGAERVLRHAMLWRERSGRTDSEAGSRFVERMLSVVATARQQNRNVLELLTACCRARLDGSAASSLLPAQAELVAA